MESDQEGRNKKENEVSEIDDWKSGKEGKSEIV